MTQPAESSKVRELLEEECDAMLQHLLDAGSSEGGSVIARAAEVLDRRDDANLRTLVRLHGELAALVHPLTPGAALRLARERGASKRLPMFGRLGGIRRMTAANAGALLMLLALALFPQVNHEEASADLLSDSGWDLAVNLGFLLAAAGVGATFGSLFKMIDKVNRNRFDPADEPAYWVQVILGVAGGIILAELMTEADEAALDGLGRPLLALLGGFSGGIVHKLLDRLVRTVEQLFASSVDDAVDREIQVAKANTGAAINAARLELAQGLMELKRSAGSIEPALEARLDDLLATVLPFDAPDPSNGQVGNGQAITPSGDEQQVTPA